VTACSVRGKPDYEVLTPRYHLGTYRMCMGDAEHSVVSLKSGAQAIKFVRTKVRLTRLKHSWCIRPFVGTQAGGEM